MGQMMILGEAKYQNTFRWDFSPKHHLEDENIKCYKACVLSPSKTHSIVMSCKICCLQVSCSKPTMASVTRRAVLTFPKDAVTGSCHTCHLIHNNKPFTLGDNEVDSWRTVHTAIWANHRKDQIWLVTHLCRLHSLDDHIQTRKRSSSSGHLSGSRSFSLQT